MASTGENVNQASEGRKEQSTTVERPTITGLNHLKLPVHSIRRTVEFYTTILPFTPLPQYDHFTPDNKLFASMFSLPSSTSPFSSGTLLLIEARYHPDQATAQKGWDPITLGVKTRADLEAWGKWFDQNSVTRSRVFVGVKGWVMGVEDPDGKVVRLYVEEEEHEWTITPDVDERWLGFVRGDPEA